MTKNENVEISYASDDGIVLMNASENQCHSSRLEYDRLVIAG
jgi:hypothetical protein